MGLNGQAPRRRRSSLNPFPTSTAQVQERVKKLASRIHRGTSGEPTEKPVGPAPERPPSLKLPGVDKDLELRLFQGVAAEAIDAGYTYRDQAASPRRHRATLWVVGKRYVWIGSSDDDLCTAGGVELDEAVLQAACKKVRITLAADGRTLVLLELGDASLVQQLLRWHEKMAPLRKKKKKKKKKLSPKPARLCKAQNLPASSLCHSPTNNIGIADYMPTRSSFHHYDNPMRSDPGKKQEEKQEVVSHVWNDAQVIVEMLRRSRSR